jgi:hypothetical protein
MSKFAKGLGVVVLALVINVGTAEAVGHGGRGGHGGAGWHGSVGWHGSGHRGRYYAGGYYGGGYYDTPNYYIEPVADVSTSQPLSPVIPPSFDLGCHHSQEIITVPSEDGGNRQIKITRC